MFVDMVESDVFSKINDTKVDDKGNFFLHIFFARDVVDQN